MNNINDKQWTTKDDKWYVDEFVNIDVWYMMNFEQWTLWSMADERWMMNDAKNNEWSTLKTLCTKNKEQLCIVNIFYRMGCSFKAC